MVIYHLTYVHSPPRYSSWSPENSDAVSPSGAVISAHSTYAWRNRPPPAPVPQVAWAFVVTVRGDSRGQVDARRCVEAGVPPGPLVAELREGREVI